MRDPGEDTTHHLLILLKVCPLVPIGSLSPELHILAHNFTKHFCFTRDHTILGTPETKQGPRTLETTQVLGSSGAMLAPKTPPLCRFLKPQWRYPIGPEDLLVHRRPGHIDQKTREETKTKGENNPLTEINSKISI